MTADRWNDTLRLVRRVLLGTVATASWMSGYGAALRRPVSGIVGLIVAVAAIVALYRLAALKVWEE